MPRTRRRRIAGSRGLALLRAGNFCLGNTPGEQTDQLLKKDDKQMHRW
jgi:hypothetical protein